MIKKEIFIGFITGILASIIGVILATLLFGDSTDIASSLKQAVADGFIGKIVSIGAILNLLVFFFFIRKKQDYRARGVILATVLVALGTFILNYF